MTTNPTGSWVTQQARNLFVRAGESLSHRRFLIRDRDTKFGSSFDEVFRTEEITVIKTPVQAPKANAFAERFVGTLRRECLDWMLIFGRRHLEAVLGEYVHHYNGHRPHRSLALVAPDNLDAPRQLTQATTRSDWIRRNDRLGGLLHEYTVAA